MEHGKSHNTRKGYRVEGKWGRRYGCWLGRCAACSCETECVTLEAQQPRELLPSLGMAGHWEDGTI